MSLYHEYTDNFFIGESSIVDAHLRLLFRAYHYETPCTTTSEISELCCTIVQKFSLSFFYLHAVNIQDSFGHGVLSSLACFENNWL